MIRKALAGAAVLLLLAAAYLGWRVHVERGLVQRKVAALAATATPEERRIPPVRIAQLLAVEDPTFWTNKGVDFSSPGAGMTTLSQGLGKRIFFDRFHPGLPKIELIVLTRFAMAPTVAKRDILTAFLASAWFGSDRGRPIEGFSAAARAKFGKSLYALSEDEWLGLVAMLPAPTSYDPLRHPAASAERVRRIKRLLAKRCVPTGLRDVALKGCAA